MAVATAPQTISAPGLNATGMMLDRDGDTEGARLHYIAALAIDQDYVPALANLGKALGDQGKLSAALAAAGRAVRLAPGETRIRNNLANLMMRANLHDAALAELTRLTEEAPEDPVTWHNLALLRYRMGAHAGALSHIDRALALMPASQGMRSDRAHMLMAMGRLAEGLEAYEARWYHLAHLKPWDHHWPEWHGEDLAGKTLLFHSEQGFGDAIMLARLAPGLAACGARVTMAVPAGLVRLLAMQEWPGVEVVDLDRFDEAGPSFDYHTPMFGALRWLGYERPEDIQSRAYVEVLTGFPLSVLPDGWRNIGLCWASGKWNMDTALRRTIPLSLFLPLASIPGVRLWSLQKGDESEGDIERFGAAGLIGNVTPHFKDWADTAALVAQLDLVIAVDTAVAHLAGAMGKPVWMLSPYTRCWRWWGIDADRSAAPCGWPWYENFRIFPQRSPGNWASTVVWLSHELETEMAR